MRASFIKRVFGLALLVCTLAAQAQDRSAESDQEEASKTVTQAAARSARKGQPVAVRTRPEELELGSTAITGSQELPKLLYIVPWKKSSLGNQVGRPLNSLLNDVLMPLDRDEFRRHIDYYEILLGQDAGTASPASE
jgi:hypothetical protein